MKKIYSFMMFAAFYGTVSAQLTQSNHAPANGDTYSMWDCGTNVNPGSGGSNATWNFSGITTNSTTILNFTAITTTNTNYPNANVSLSSSASNVSHYKSTSGELLYYGGNISVNTSVAGTLTYTDAAVEAVYPMSLNSTTSAPISGSIQVTAPFPLAGTFAGNSNATIDGQGTLILPGGGTYSNVFRVVTSQTINITAAASAVVNKITYNYYAPGIKAPVISILTATGTVTGSSPSTQTIVTRNTAALGASTTTTSIHSYSSDADIRVYPNPANEAFEIRTGSDKDMTLKLTDITGKMVAAYQVRETARINTSELPAGIYIYSVSQEGMNVKTGKLTIIH